MMCNQLGLTASAIGDGRQGNCTSLETKFQIAGKELDLHVISELCDCINGAKNVYIERVIDCEISERE